MKKLVDFELVVKSCPRDDETNRQTGILKGPQIICDSDAASIVRSAVPMPLRGQLSFMANATMNENFCMDFRFALYSLYLFYTCFCNVEPQAVQLVDGKDCYGDCRGMKSHAQGRIGKKTIS